MNKKIAIITGLIIILLTVAMMGKLNQKKEVDNIPAQEVTEPQKVETQEPEQTLSENQVWYEVPELGIKFITTQDTATDLNYTYQGYRMLDFPLDVKAITFYSSSETNDSLEGCRPSEEGFNCGLFHIDKISKDQNADFRDKLNREWCEGAKGQRILENETDIVCLFKSKTDLSIDENYKKFFHMKGAKDKTFGMFLESMKFLDNDKEFFAEGVDTLSPSQIVETFLKSTMTIDQSSVLSKKINPKELLSLDLQKQYDTTAAFVTRKLSVQDYPNDIKIISAVEDKMNARVTAAGIYGENKEYWEFKLRKYDTGWKITDFGGKIHDYKTDLK